ncbi:MAG: cytochrome c3 family protein [Armatimonadota bacterium]
MALSRSKRIGVGFGARAVLSAIVLGVAHMAIAQTSAKATYTEGMDKVCGVCHKALTPKIVDAFSKTSHPVAMRAGSEAGAVAAVFDEDSPLAKESIAYVMLWGPYQVYVDKDMKTLRGKWNVAAKKWETMEVVDATTELIPKHTTGWDPATKKWAEMGVKCESCHGPGSIHKGTAKKLDIVNPKKQTAGKLAMICAQCHAVGASKDGTVRYAKGYKPGDDINSFLVVDKVTKPGTHQEYNEWVTSKHATAGIECNSCHVVHGEGSANHAQLVKPLPDLCLTCHKDVIASAKHPKFKPEETCSACHMPQGMHTFSKPGAAAL